jgi:signal peptidase I
MDAQDTTPPPTEPVGAQPLAGSPSGDRPSGDGPSGDGPDGTAAAKVTRATHKDPVSHWRNAAEWVVVIVGAVVVALLVRHFVVQSYKIPSGSMHPTLLEGDRVLVNRLSYRLHDVNRGDVIVFSRPDTSPAAPGEPADLIKRVIALPGETIVARDGIVYVDDRAIEEPYLPDGTQTLELDQPVTVPDGEVFVMGDNRTNSSDSRYIGTIPIDSIQGRAFAVIWPFGRWSGL